MKRNQSRGGRANRRWRKVRASWRDTLLLFGEFRWPLLVLTLVMIGGGLFYYWLAGLVGQPAGSVAEAVYLMLVLTFLQPIGDFPQAWPLQAFYFLMPLIGIGILAQGLTEFGLLFFNRQARSKEWEMAVASTFRDHIILVGLGHLGFRVAQALYELDQEVVVLELDPQADLIAATREMDIPVIREDAKRKEALEAAGVDRASTIVICTQNDNLNLQIAFKARKINPDIRVVIRIFDDDFAQALEEQFGFRAMSATGMAAPIFATAAAGVDITRPITVEGEALSLACLNVRPQSRLVGCSVSEIEQSYDVSVVLLRHDGASDFHPAGDRQLADQDVVAVLAGPEQISRLVEHNR
ncbi:MAG: TrkA family potassium uptake protein [Chloroflexi bacterium]|nr:TrkA family potassium uptake protein [Chloroflexota bacterium]MCI0576624.1 TrkA family potassium uptake protein [Chloroflexota bacterium]MCI0647008.1 TrkA family potassium uptake protein [Chloroflexota bacterium]MCI0730708.1 TrkA family potassium uptake protein [Chloroflexota bacterium]